MEHERSPAVGGHPALDLCNTRAWRRDPERDIDRIATPEACARWYGAAVDGAAGKRLLRTVAEDPAAAAAGLRAVHRLRSTLTEWLDGHIDGANPDGSSGAAVAFGRLWRGAAGRAEVGADLPLRWEVGPVEDLGRAADWLTLTASDLLRSPDLGVLRRCAQHDCGWFFLDRTKNGSRRWCIASDCGNLERVRAYAARRRAGR